MSDQTDLVFNTKDQSKANARTKNKHSTFILTNPEKIQETEIKNREKVKLSVTKQC